MRGSNHANNAVSEFYPKPRFYFFSLIIRIFTLYDFQEKRIPQPLSAGELEQLE